MHPVRHLPIRRTARRAGAFPGLAPRAVTVLAAGMVLASLAAPLQTVAAEPAVSLKGVNILEGDASGYVRVRVPSRVTVDSAFSTNKSVSVSGTGRLQGIVLRQLGVAERSDEAMLAAGRFDPAIFCDETCTKPANGISVVSNQPLSDEYAFILPAGDYHLHLVTDGGPARVTLRVPELAGEQRLSPTARTRSSMAALPSRTPTDVPNMRVHGGSGALRTDGVVFWTHLRYYGLHGESEIWACAYSGQPSLPLAFYPGCPTENTEERIPRQWWQDARVNPGPGAAALVGLMRPATAGTYSVGGSVTTAAIAGSSGWAAAWIDLEPS